MPRIIILGTCDTKLEELIYLRTQIQSLGGPSYNLTLVDAGRSPTQHPQIDVQQDDLTSKYASPGEKKEAKDVSALPRGDLISYMIACATNWLQETYDAGLKNSDAAVHGIIAAGGTGNTSLAAAVMRAVLPLGFPKLIVSTNASADVSPVVGETDICMMPSIVDIAGNNPLLQRILGNAAGAIVGMSRAYALALDVRNSGDKPSDIDGNNNSKYKRVGISMFGVTTPAVETIRRHLSTHHPSLSTYIFHQTGAGGRALERLVSEGGLDAVVDLTTTELCDHECGGVMDSGPHRLEAALKAGIPYIISCGALDMCNFGPKNTVPERYQGRKLLEHNPTVTLMRTNVAESTAIARSIVEKVGTHAKDKGRVEVWLPLGGVSVVATPGGPFYDAEADEALFSTLREGLEGVRVVEDARAINDEGFAVDVAKRLVQMMGL